MLDPRNGPKHHTCTHESDFTAMDERLTSLEYTQGRILSEAASAHEQSALARVAAERCADEINKFASEYRMNERETVRQVRALAVRVDRMDAARRSLDWELDEDTNVGQRDPATSASLWAVRARSAAEDLAATQAQLAAAQATLAERERQSDHARADQRAAGEMSVARWKLVVGAIVTLLGAGGGVAAILSRMLGD